MPKKFKFRLESVLKIRKVKKDIQEAKLAQASRACNETQNYISALNDKQHEVYGYMIKNAEQSFSLSDHQNNEAFNAKIITERSKEYVRLAKREKAKDFERVRYVKLAQGVKAIEKLKTKALELHQKDLLDEEMKQIDDLVSSRYRVQDS